MQIIAKCGYRCDLCMAFEANLKRDADRRRMSEALATYYNFQIAPEMIQPCKGCVQAEETPDKDCQVFPCVRDKGLAHCGQCPDFGCDRLKTRMDVVEQMLGKHLNIPDEDYQLFFRPYLSRATFAEIRKSPDG
mgnify:FL=1